MVSKADIVGIAVTVITAIASFAWMISEIHQNVLQLDKDLARIKDKVEVLEDAVSRIEGKIF